MSDPREWTQRAARLSPVTNHPLSLVLLTATPPEGVAHAFAAADLAVSHGRAPLEVLRNLLDYLDDHPMPTDDVEWAIVASSL